MTDADCIFCKIVQKAIPATIVHEEEDVLVFNNIKPVAPIHLLIIPKRHIDSVGATQDDDRALLGQLQLVARDVARQLKLDGFKLAVSSGASAGQTVFHLHYHFLSGQIAPGGLQSL